MYEILNQTLELFEICVLIWGLGMSYCSWVNCDPIVEVKFLLQLLCSTEPSHIPHPHPHIFTHPSTHPPLSVMF